MTSPVLCFVAPPFSGHLNPQLALAQAAADAGYDVSVITGARKEEMIRRRGLRPHRLTSIEPDALERIVNWPKKVIGNPLTLIAQTRRGLAVQALIVRELHDLWQRRPPDLVIADFMMPAGGVAAARLGIPWITTIPTPFALENNRGVPAYLGGLMPLGGKTGEMRDAAARFFAHHFKQTVFTLFRGEFAGAGIDPYYREDGSEALYSERAILGFGLEELEFDRDWPPGFQMIGPVIDNPEDCPAIDYPSGRRVLVTLGTHLPWAKERVTDQVRDLAAYFPDMQFVIALGRADRISGQPLESFGNVTVYPFVPYGRDLRLFDAVIHHGGAGICYACIAAAKPSLIIPQDYDQFDFAARMVHHGLGLRVKSLGGKDVGAALAQLFTLPLMPNLLRFKICLESYQPEQAFLDTVENIIGGTNLQEAIQA